jgi:hypothetical protein
MDKKTIVKAYQFDDELLKKFKVAKDGEWSKVNKIKVSDLISIYIAKFK